MRNNTNRTVGFSSLGYRTRSRLMLYYSLAFILRVLVFLSFSVMWLVLSLERTEVLLRAYGGTLLVVTVYAFAVLLSFLLLLFSSSLRTGTEKLFLSAASGGAVRLHVLFSECTPQSACRSLALECALFFFKSLWYVTALLPFAGLAVVTRVLVSETQLSFNVYRALTAGCVMLLSTALIFMRAVSVRCSFARCCLICGAPSVKSAKEHSAVLSDSLIISSCVKALPHYAAVLACVFILPAPFILSRIRFARTACFAELLYAQEKPVMPPNKKPIVLERKFA